MLFIEPRFFIFFAAVFAAYWRLRENRARKILLLVASYLFYAAWDWRFVGLIWLSTVVDFSIGRALARMGPSPWRKRLLAASVILNLGILSAFKYFDFFVSPFSSWTAKLVLPVGISFYTFETISYVVDVYRGERPAKSLLDFGLFLAFFPHLVSGPILRPGEFLPQLDEPKRWQDVDVRGSLVLFLGGLVKKTCIGDALPLLIDPVYATPGTHGAAATWVATIFFAVQVYCDFSGYTDMAIAAAQLLGYEMPRNFDAPFLAPTVTDFWRRWHMSLSRFLRDYLYIPLGGGRGPQWRVFLNLMITMTLGGLWHGAAWTFVVWGALHGLAISVERVIPTRRLPRAAGAAITFLFFAIVFIVFRSPNLSVAAQVMRGLVDFHTPGGSLAPFALFAALALAHVAITAKTDALERWWRGLGPTGFAIGYGATWAAVLPFAALGTHPFFYFQF
jgi:alginate O-acetyltransferase complex protein AlgI